MASDKEGMFEENSEEGSQEFCPGCWSCAVAESPAPEGPHPLFNVLLT
jgi:hypothetical protein